MDSENVTIAAVVAAVVSAFAGLIASFGVNIIKPILDRRAAASGEETSKIMMVVDELKKQINDLRTQLEIANRDKERLQARLFALEAQQAGMPFPTWTTDLGGHYTSLNQAYVSHLLTPADKTVSDVLGKRNVEIWSDNVATLLTGIYDLASIHRTAQARSVSFDGSARRWTIYKCPLYAGGVQVGWTGLATPDDTPIYLSGEN